MTWSGQAWNASAKKSRAEKVERMDRLVAWLREHPARSVTDITAAMPWESRQATERYLWQLQREQRVESEWADRGRTSLKLWSVTL